MTPEQLLQNLRDSKVELWVEGRQLHYRGPAGLMTAELLQTIAHCKSEIIEILQSNQTQDPVLRESWPLSFSQQRIWFFEMLASRLPVYNASCVYRISGFLDIDILQSSLHQIVARHWALRSYVPSEEGLKQFISHDTRVPFKIVDLSNMPDTRRETEATKSAAAEVRCPLKLTEPPLLRAAVIKIDHREFLFVLVTHHFCMDGYSLRTIFMRELSEYYNAILKNNPVRLPVLPMQYPHYVIIERNRVSADSMEEHAEYWKQKLAQVPRYLELPFAMKRPMVTTYRGATFEFIVERLLNDKVAMLCRSLKVTQFIFYLAVFQSLLYRYTGEKHIAVGTTVTHRPMAELENLIGPFANNLILIADFEQTQTFNDLLSQMYRETTAAFVHQDLPFEKLVDFENPDRNLNFNPLFQLLFMYHETSTGSTLRMEGATNQSIRIDKGISRFDLSMELIDDQGGMTGHIEYNTDIFKKNHISRLSIHFRNFLEAVVDNTDSPVSLINYLNPDEYIEISSCLRQSIPAKFSRNCIHELFERYAANQPDSVAIKTGYRTITYRELNDKANFIAGHLQDNGFGPDDVIGICVERSSEMIACLLGILKSGCAYVPFDPIYPEARIRFMAEDSGAKYVIVNDKHKPLLHNFKGKTKALEAILTEDVSFYTENVRSNVSPQNPAYLIYTSGSTGKPKGICVEHRNVDALLEWARGIWGQEERRGVLASTSISFDLSVFEIFFPLCSGGSVILVDNIFDLVTDELRATGVTLINSTPSAVNELLRIHTIPESVKTVNLAGEPLPADLAEKLYHIETIQNVYNLYGPSECTVYSTYYRVQPQGKRQPLIGRPVDGTRLYIMDEYLQQVPFEVPGELYIGGEGLARGYVGAAQNSSNGFQRCPDSRVAGERLYRTGDRVRLESNGELQFMGRYDNQIKIHGCRIEPGEIESVIRSHNDIVDAAVIQNKDISGNRHLVGYVVTDSCKEVKSEELRTFLASKLPVYMIPAGFVLLESMPTLPNGKTDQKRLPEYKETIEISTSSLSKPENLQERLIRKIWKEVLNVEEVGLNENFFDAGGNSLFLVQVLSKLKKRHRYDLTLIDLFLNPTIAALARFITQSKTKPDLLRQRVIMRAEAQISALNRRKTDLSQR